MVRILVIAGLVISVVSIILAVKYLLLKKCELANDKKNCILTLLLGIVSTALSVACLVII